MEPNAVRAPDDPARSTPAHRHRRQGRLGHLERPDPASVRATGALLSCTPGAAGAGSARVPDHQTEHQKTGRERSLANLRPKPPWKPGCPSPNVMGRPARKRLGYALECLADGDVDEFRKLPNAVQSLALAAWKMAHKVPAFFSEVIVRTDGHVEKNLPAELPRPTVIVQQITQVAVSGQLEPVRASPEGRNFSASGTGDPESITTSAEVRKPRHMPILEPPKAAQLPSVGGGR